MMKQNLEHMGSLRRDSFIGIAIFAFALLSFPVESWSKEPLKTIYVNNLSGNDNTGDGSKEKPFSRIMRGVKELRPGIMLNIANTGTAYHETIRISVAGTAEDPVIIEGNGAINSGMMRRPTSDWKVEGGDVFSIKLPNNAWGMPNYWEGGFELVRFAEKPGRNVTSKEALEPYAYFLYKNQKELKTDPLHNTLFIRLPAGKTPDEIEVQVISLFSPLCVDASHVTVRNLISEYSGDDGFSTVKPAVNIVFEGVEARFNMDQGISHHGSGVVVRRSRFHHNAGCGVVDVYPEVKVRYENCIIEADTWRGGIEFHSGTFEMVDCLIRANPKTALTVTRGARVKLRNCLLIAPEPGTTTGLGFDGAGSELEMENCTFYGFAIGFNARIVATGRVKIDRCAWLRCKINSNIRGVQASGDAPVDLTSCLRFAGNLYEPAPWEVLLQQQAEGGGWKNDSRKFTATDHAGFAKLIGSDGDAVIMTVDGATDPLNLPALNKDSNGAEIGASLSKMELNKITEF